MMGIRAQLLQPEKHLGPEARTVGSLFPWVSFQEERAIQAGLPIRALLKGASKLTATWAPKVCKINSCMAIIMGLGVFFYILFGFRNNLHRGVVWSLQARHVRQRKHVASRLNEGPSPQSLWPPL